MTQRLMANIEAIRNLAHWAYYSNGVVASGIDYMRTMHTLDGVIVSRSKRADGKRPRNYRMNKQKMEATLHTIRYKQIHEVCAGYRKEQYHVIKRTGYFME